MLFVYVLSSERGVFSKLAGLHAYRLICFVFFVSAVPGKGEDRDQDEALPEFML